MPRYDYRCSAGHQYERTEPFGSPVEHACDQCGKQARRVPVAPPLIFKAGGFYKTSSRSSSRSSSDSAATEAAASASAKSAEQKNALDISAPSPSQAHSSPTSES